MIKNEVCFNYSKQKLSNNDKQTVSCKEYKARHIIAIFQASFVSFETEKGENPRTHQITNGHDFHREDLAWTFKPDKITGKCPN